MSVQSPAAFMKTEQPKLTEAVLARLTASPLEWVDAHELAEVGGFCGWRTRISEARQRLERDQRGTIEWNEQPRASAYRYLPYVPQGRDAASPIPQPPLFDIHPRG